MGDIVKTKAQIQEEFREHTNFLNEEIDAGRMSFDDYLTRIGALEAIFQYEMEESCLEDNHTTALNAL